MGRPSLVALLLLLPACNASVEAEDTSRAAVNVAALGQFTVATTDLKGPIQLAQRASGAPFVPSLEFSNSRYTCGVTFIDRTHAITAGHCVDVVDVPDQRTLNVEFFDVDPNLDWMSAAKITGRYPNYEHPRLAGAPGYRVSRIACRVLSRCGFGQLACPPKATADHADIALLQCSEGLPTDREPVDVAQADDERGPVTLFWFHEIYDGPNSTPAADDEAARDLFDHYTLGGGQV